METSQTWIIRTTEVMDNEDCDQVGFQVDEETYPHDEWLKTHDWARHDETIIDEEYDDNGRLRRIILESFGQEYDRSAEEYCPVIWTRDIERTEVNR